MQTMAETKIVARPWQPQDLIDDLQGIIDEECDNYLNTRRTTLCMARDYLKEHFAEQKWIPVTERLPIEEAKAHEQEWCETYCEFLVMIERGLLPTTLYYDWENNEWFRINTALERETYKVTHWMPLPQPPKGE